MRDLLSPELLTDQRVQGPSPVLQRVFSHEFYEIYVGLYPGGLITALVHYKRENLRIMRKLAEAPKDVSTWAQYAVKQLQASNMGPYHLVRDAKLATKIMLSLHDRAALRMAGVEVPLSAGRYKDMFG